jgi:hypothetical protein
MTEEQLQIQKRLTLNWLIQGAAQHAGMTFHHLVRDELNLINPTLLHLYDQYALINLLQYWQPEAKLLLGSPDRFWKQAATRANHPFYGHPLLSKYGGMLAEVSRQRGLERCKEKGFTRLPIAFSFQAVWVVQRLSMLEAPHRFALAQLGKRTASMVWGIPGERIDGELTARVVIPSDFPPARTASGMVFRAGIVGLGGVVRRNKGLMVIARGTNWQLLAKELVKGTAELICLHGLNTLSDDTYGRVIDVADRVDYEPWMLQSGGELWRRLLAVVPDRCSIAHVLMHLARLPVERLQSIISNVIEKSEFARCQLAEVIGSDDLRQGANP